jgi:cell wall-associated NlpC family hydrolase
MQDCTALVENSLRAVGIPAGDLGTQIGEYTGLGGTLVTSGDYAPGDVLIWSGRHVAVYIGNGQAVHGGYGGNQTVVAGAFIDGAPSGVVRFG